MALELPQFVPVADRFVRLNSPVKRIAASDEVRRHEHDCGKRKSLEPGERYLEVRAVSVVKRNENGAIGQSLLVLQPQEQVLTRNHLPIVVAQISQLVDECPLRYVIP